MSSGTTRISILCISENLEIFLNLLSLFHVISPSRHTMCRNTGMLYCACIFVPLKTFSNFKYIDYSVRNVLYIAAQIHFGVEMYASPYLANLNQLS